MDSPFFISSILYKNTVIKVFVFSAMFKSTITKVFMLSATYKNTITKVFVLSATYKCTITKVFILSAKYKSTFAKVFMLLTITKTWLPKFLYNKKLLYLKKNCNCTKCRKLNNTTLSRLWMILIHASIKNLFQQKNE